MPKRLLHPLAILLLIVGAMTFIVAPSSADAASDCDLVIDPFVVRDDGFNPVFMRDTVSASEILDFFGGDTEEAIRDAESVLRVPTLPPGVPEFYAAAIDWYAFTAAGECADAVVYPGPFENMPTTPAAPYGLSLNPVANPSATSFSSDAPAAVAAVSVPASATLAHTGTETNTLLYFSAGLVGFGALALGSKRRFL